STSRNWAVWLDEFLEEFSPDPLRYYLASIAPESKDSDFAWRDFQSRNNNELADIFGNFINRSLTFIGRYHEGVVPEPVDLNEEDRDILAKLVTAKEAIGDHFERFQVRAAVREYVILGNHLNKYFNDQEPWKTRKTAPERCACTLYVCAQAVRSLAIIMAPVLPFSAAKIWSMLQLEGTVDQQHWDRGAEPEVKAGHVLGTPEILFTKIDDEVVEAQIAKLGAGTLEANVTESTVAANEETDTISFSDFQELDIRIAEIVSAEKVPKADRLLQLKIRIGAEERQIVAGIAQQYEPDQLIGRQIVVLANLEPATIRGVESQGMLLAATNDQEQPILLRPDEGVNSGARVK
ncbi:MAG: methionine--tRNA ligase subunit beta, partial [Candidatus Latescibacteria bacterium]|nr:methionine--tRNA ligase subunit beta [Candidatus Latescibacterota bacterium]